MATTNTNIAMGNACVGIQAYQITGPIHVGLDSVAPAELHAELFALRAQLKHANTAGQIDDETHQAAQAELNTAEHHLTGDAAERSKLVLALKRLRGLVSDIAELAAKVTAIITAVRSTW